VKLPSLEKPPAPPPKPEVKKPEPKPEPKPVEAKKPEPPKPEPKVEQKPPEPPKAAQATAKPTVAPKPAETKAAVETKPGAEAKPAGKPGGKPEGAADGGDAYAAAADKWRVKGATGGGGGLGGTDTSPGPLGTPGYGGGGGGQVVGFEFLAYQQRVVTTVKSVWTNAAPRPGLVAKVRFQIAANGEVSGIRLEHPSGDGVFDGSALRAVQRANPLPPPPARYANEFRDFVIEFHSEEGGQASG
jgi:TolA protein